MPPADDDPDDHDPEGPDPEEMDYSDEPDLDVCPHCRKLIYEEAERCPHCGGFISLEETPLSPRAWMVIALVIVLLTASLFWMLR